MNRKFFIKRLAKLQFLMTIPLLILGIVTTTLVFRVLQSRQMKSNISQMNVTMENIELMLNELDSLSLCIESNAKISNKYYSILNSNQLSYNTMKELDILRASLNSPVNARAYIYSIYVYYPNRNDRFILSNKGISVIGDFYDKDWYNSYLENQNSANVWSERRTIYPYSFEEEGTSIVSIYKMLNNKGVIVLNIDPEYIENNDNLSQLFNNQSVYIFNEDDSPILHIGRSCDISRLDFNKVKKQYDVVGIEGVNYIMYRIQSKKYGWTFVSLIPERKFYEITYDMFSIIFVFIILMLFCSIVATFVMIKRNQNRIEYIGRMLDSAKSGKLISSKEKKISDEYTYIIQKIVSNFIEQDYLKMQLSERKYKLRTMEYLALQSQINPHFLYNTLETINWKAIALAGGPNEVSEMIGDLSDIMLYSLESSNEFVPMSKEIENTRSYITIQKKRYRDSFDVIWEYDEDVTGVMVAKLILQPLVENSISHGFIDKNRPGIIKIKMKVSEDCLKISVIDNGVGIEKKKLLKLREKLYSETKMSSHIGVFNTERRLVLLYGKPNGIKIYSKVNCGTLVNILLPIRNTDIRLS